MLEGYVVEINKERDQRNKEMRQLNVALKGCRRY